MHFHGAPKSKAAKPPSPKDIIRERYEDGRNLDLEKLFHDIFFSALANRLAGSECPLNIVKLLEGGSPWIFAAIKALRDAANKIADGTYQLSFTTPFFAARGIESVSGARPTEAASMQYQALKHALRKIAALPEKPDRKSCTAQPGGTYVGAIIGPLDRRSLDRR
jgi:hypothetical protein